ncbi:SMI1 / KNR4 family (SUKH-1) [Prosthecobacter debontii]|uniref:SMI1 / KNR4 family (SUKH-1) n=1 Tax=Prosthecobacter debontii TaxID=48467 RepID=A0A1T4YFB2_9BACT|nr:SMI1/KNR4 family protein [Prosthecobacter debontii]SKB00476.1 SMI1 / KNR4 family (SUKH-1) [Prosthecobacter debontii]
MIPEALIAYRRTGGAEFAFTDGAPGYFQLWPENEIQQWNLDYQVSEYAPGFIGFGSDGGGEMLAFDKTGAVYMIPFIGMSPEDAQKIAESWSEIAQRIEK